MVRANRMSRAVSATRSGRAVMLPGEDGDVVMVVRAVFIAEVGITVGNCSLFHWGCAPSTSVLEVLVGVSPLCPGFAVFPPGPFCPFEGEVPVGVAWKDALLASIVGALVTCQVEVPSA